ncbi:MAG: hypothetical protein ACRDZX_01855 [Acidimicrobiales bacterium]
MTSVLSAPLSIGLHSLSGLVAAALFKAFIGWEVDVVQWLMAGAIHAASATTSISPAEGNGWFTSVAHQMFPVDAMVVTPLLFAATIGAIVRQDLHRLTRAWAVGLPLALIGGYAIVRLSFTGLGVTDDLSLVIRAQVAPNLKKELLGAVTSGISLGPAGALASVVGLVVIFAGLAIWLELALRAACVELAVFFMPLAFAGLVWPSTAHWAKRLLQVLSALLLAKPVIVGALCLGARALTGPKAGASSMVSGCAILLMAAFAPLVLLKLVPVVEASAVAHLQGVSRQPFHAVERSVQRAMSVVGRAGIAARALRSDSAAQLLNQLGSGTDSRGGGGGQGGSGTLTEAERLGPARSSGAGGSETGAAAPADAVLVPTGAAAASG